MRTVSRKSIADFLNPYQCLQHELTSIKVTVCYRRRAQKGMADYYPLISNAVTALEKKGSEGRSAFYDRARAILGEKFQKADPPLSETIIEQERLALEDAISKVEADATRSEETGPGSAFVACLSQPESQSAFGPSKVSIRAAISASWGISRNPLVDETPRAVRQAD